MAVSMSNQSLMTSV